MESEGFQPFVYQHEDRRRMPLFSSDDLAAEFAKWYALETQRIIPLQVLGVDGAMVAPSFGDCDVVVLNDRTKHEVVLSDEDTALLKAACGLSLSVSAANPAHRLYERVGFAKVAEVGSSYTMVMRWA